MATFTRINFTRFNIGVVEEAPDLPGGLPQDAGKLLTIESATLTTGAAIKGGAALGVGTAAAVGGEVALIPYGMSLGDIAKTFNEEKTAASTKWKAAGDKFVAEYLACKDACPPDPPPPVQACPVPAAAGSTPPPASPPVAP